MRYQMKADKQFGHTLDIAVVKTEYISSAAAEIID